MLLQRIELKNFLKHRTNNSGEDGFVAIDFCSSPLWLIYGPNGVGKSAIFDAITFALFEEHRGSGSKDHWSHRLINDAADNAAINLEIKLGGERYQIQRTITRKSRKGKGKKDSASVWGIVRRWTDRGWIAVPDTENNIDAWVQEHLRMSYENFVSSVLLRQGEADAFLKALPSKRKTRLLEMLNLKFYERLGEAANHKLTEWRKTTESHQKEIERMQPVTDADLESQSERINALNGLLDEAKQKLTHAKAKLSDARLAFELSNSIEQKEKQRQEDVALITRKEEIRAAARRLREIQSALPLLENLWAARRRLTEEVSEIEKAQASLTAFEKEKGDLSAQLDKAHRDEESANEVLISANAVLGRALEQQSQLAKQMEQLEQIERLESQIHQAKEKLKPHEEVLEQAGEIERSRRRYETLRDMLPLLENLEEAHTNCAEAQRKLTTAQDAFAKGEQTAKDAKAEEEKWRELSEATVSEQQAVKDSLSELHNKLSRLREKLDNRNSITGEEECPVCGSTLNSDDVRSRIAGERAHWQEEIAQLEVEEKSLGEQLKIKEKARSDAQVEFKKAADAARQAENSLALQQGHFENTHSALTSAKTVLDKALVKARDWADQINELPSLKAEHERLKSTPEELRKIQEARQAESAFKAVADNCQEQLQDLPAWSPDERGHLKSQAAEIARIAVKREQEKQVAENAASNALAYRERLSEQQREAESNIKVVESRLGDLQKRKRQAKVELKHHQDGLTPEWKNHPACADENKLNELKKEQERLGHAKQEEEQLSQADRRSLELAGAIEELHKQFRGILVHHRCPVSEAEAEHNTAEQAAQRVEGELDKAKQELARMKHQKEVYDERQEDRDDAEREMSYYRRLSDAFGRLKTEVIKTAQEAIQRNANKTLSLLSNGMWRIELEENAQKTELEILACDLSQLGMPRRPFAYLSGGEKFRVAISLAVGIGQSVSGGQTADTLIIDEGFGALDKVNRELLISELSRLSEEVLRGGRVIVVSHQEDVCEGFGSRYRIFNDTNGSTQIEREPPY